MLEVLGIKNADKLVPLPEDMKPQDPVTENQRILKEEPVKAFLYQDHQAHMQVHMALLQDPMIAQAIGQNPAAQKIQAALMAHVAEHAGFAYRAQIEQQMGLVLPPEDQKLPPEVEQGLSAMMAQAAQQTMMRNQAMAQQQAAQQQMQDPLVQMQMQELQIKQQEAQAKMQEVQLKAQIAQQELQLKMQEAERRAQLEGARLAADATFKSDQLELKERELESRTQLEAMRTTAQSEQQKAKLEADQQREGVRMGIDIAKSRQQAAAAARAAAQKPPSKGPSNT